MTAPPGPPKASQGPLGPPPRPRSSAAARGSMERGAPRHSRPGPTDGHRPASGLGASYAGATSASAVIAAANAVERYSYCCGRHGWRWGHCHVWRWRHIKGKLAVSPRGWPFCPRLLPLGSASRQQRSQHLVSFLVWNVSGLSEVSAVLHETWAYIAQFDVIMLSETQTPASLHQQLPNHIVHTILASTVGGRGEGLLLAVQRQLPFSITHRVTDLLAKRVLARRKVDTCRNSYQSVTLALSLKPLDLLRTCLLSDGLASMS